MNQKTLSLAVLPLLALADPFPGESVTREPPEGVRPAGIVLLTRSTLLQSGESWTNRISIQGGDILMQFGDTGTRSGSMVYLAAGQELILNDDAERSYMRVDREYVDALAANMSFAMKQMEKALAAMPEEQRKMMMEASGGRMPGLGDASGRPGPEIRDTGETATKSDYSTRRYDVVSGDLMTRQLWVADWSSVEHGAELRAAFESLASLWASFRETVGDKPFGGVSEEMVLILKHGLPVITTEFDEEGTPTIETALESIAEAEVDRSKFAPKEGYRELEMPRMPGE